MFWSFYLLKFTRTMNNDPFETERALTRATLVDGERVEPRYRSYDVIAGHGNVNVNNSSQNRGRAVSEVSLCLSCYNTSTDTQHDIPGPFIRSIPLTRPDAKFSN